MNNKKIKVMNLAAPCGIYCGTCRQYLVLQKNLLQERGFKRGCEGCRIRNKNCTFIKKDCAKIRKMESNFCFECEEFPCANLIDLNDIYIEEREMEVFIGKKVYEKLIALSKGNNSFKDVGNAFIELFKIRKMTFPMGSIFKELESFITLFDGKPERYEAFIELCPECKLPKSR